MRMLVVFLDLTEPASRKANPVCITVRESHIAKLTPSLLETYHRDMKLKAG